MNRAPTQTRPRNAETGFALLDALLSLAILGIVAAVFLGAIGTGDKAAIVADRNVTAESVARAQLEHLKTLSYIDYSVSGHATYSPTAVPANYAVTLAAVPVSPTSLQPLPSGQDQGMQYVAVTVSLNSQHLFTVHDVKVNR